MQETLSNNTQNKIILITGATSGIGYALSEIYLKNNWIVIGLGRDKNKIKYAEVAIICNASSSRMKTRKANVKTRGKEILQMIDVIARDKKCKYVALKALDNVITYYHKFGFRLVNYPFHKERPEISEYVGRLGRINTAIDKINNKRSTRKHRNHHDNSKLEKLHGEKDMIMEKFKRFLVGLYDVKAVSYTHLRAHET